MTEQADRMIDNSATFSPRVSKERYFQQTAKRFALDARLLRCRAAIHVENKDDIVFWSQVLEHFRPGDRFHFIAGSRNENGHETRGVTQCLKYLPYLGPRFLICIDSDYRRLTRERGIDARHHVLQTYTYSFENHHCFAGGLDEVCRRITTLPNNVFDFKAFLESYSQAVYELFLWHVHFLLTEPQHFPASEFNELVSLSGQRRPDIRDNGRRELNRIRGRAGRKVNYLRRAYPGTNARRLGDKYRSLGLTPSTTYLFIRGHNIYDMVHALMREVCKKVLRDAKARFTGPRPKVNLFGYRNSIDQELKRHICFDAYPAIRMVGQDIKEVF